jgi:hypothetical protein
MMLNAMFIMMMSTVLYTQVMPESKEKIKSRMLLHLNIKVGKHIFAASVADSHTSQALIQLLPLTLSMEELNGNEKYGDLPKALPTAEASPGTIEKGDIMLYGSRTLVVFYDSFRTPYRYTRIGRIDDVKELAEALGEGKIAVELSSPVKP